MSGVELTVGGWFASSIIRSVIDMARSVLGSNHALQNKTSEMLTSLENSLPHIQATIEATRKSPITNSGLIRWMENLKNAAYEVKDVLDDIEAKRIRQSLNRKDKVTQFISSSGKFVKTLIFSDKRLKGFKSAVEKFSTISIGIGDFINILQHEYNTNANTEHTKTKRRETSSYLDPNSKIFGRDIEICSILDIILNQITSFPQGNSERREVKGNTSEVDGQEISNKKSVVNEQSFGITTYEKGNTSEVETKGKGKEISSTVASIVRIRNWKLPVLPICGLGGVGKTTIAQMVYNNDIVTEIFDLRAWVYVPENFDGMEIMKKIVRKLGGSIITHMDLDSITRELNRIIENKRFFLVLDDVHDAIESIWSDLYPVLGNGAPGSFVLVTTQSERVARTIGNMSIIIQLGVLEPEWFDLIFKYYAFGDFFYFDPESGTSSISRRNNVERAQLLNLDEEKLSDLKSIATKIAKKLHGLPLVGRVIGKMLYANLERKHWEKILGSDWWDDEKTYKEILSSLSIGYKDLDPELQQCFKFCSIFPKHYEFDKNRLVQMWMAHDDDFIQPNEGEGFKLHIKKIRLEDVGGERFDKLVERSFLEAKISDGKYVMHDLIRELAIAVSAKQEFYHVKSLDNKIPSVTHHMGISCDGSSEEISPIYTKSRTVILFGDWENSQSISNIFAESKGLRLLDLAKNVDKNVGFIGMRKTIDNNVAILNVICELSHLRYVNLSFSGIEFIPDKLCELYHLQVLDVRGCNFKKVPKGMNNLIKLRHLYANADIVNLISGIGKLTNLQELEEFRITRSEDHRISELRDMNEISGHLLLTGLDNVKNKEEAATSQLDKKKYLESLEFHFTHISKVEPEVVEALKPPPSVEMFTIKGSRSTEEYLPSWFCNLKCIQVGNSWLKTLPAFGELPALEVLSLDDMILIKTIGNEFYGRLDVKFPSLKKLTFSEMPRWTEWLDAPAGIKSFPHLEKIHVVNCDVLQKMPTGSFTLSMVELELLGCPSIHNIETILEIPLLTILSISRLYDLSIGGTVLRNLEVMCLRDVARVWFHGGLESLNKLRKLEIMGFIEIHGSLVQSRQLASLHMDHSRSKCSTQSLPMLGRLENLRFLLISNSPVTEYTEEEESWFNQLTSLETLEFSNCRKLTRLPSTLPLLTKLKKLAIADCHMISSLPEFGLPENLSALEMLELSGCWKLTHLPSKLPLLTKLKKLTIAGCPMIFSLPEAGLPPNLTELYINKCSYELVERCKSKEVSREQFSIIRGDDQWKISHIPHVVIER